MEAVHDAKSTLQNVFPMIDGIFRAVRNKSIEKHSKVFYNDCATERSTIFLTVRRVIMKKFQKLALVAAMTATVSCVGMFAGCSAPAKEEVGIYHYNLTNFSKITQGWLLASWADTITIYSDNTFSLSSVYDSYYSSDGEAFSPVYYSACTAYGTYEIVSEDADLGEKTIKITDITKCVVDGETVVLKEEFTDKVIEATKKVLDKEVILTFDYKISDSISVSGVANALKAE